MEFQNYFDSTEAQLAMFIKMAKSDGEINQAEMIFLRLLAHKLKISNADFENIIIIVINMNISHLSAKRKDLLPFMF